jgi:tetratricopeptide (TPR) repeat protein
MKVFLSSTGRDLKDYREAAFRTIQRLGHHCVRMEDFTGPAIPIETFDESKVLDCDLFIILIGFLHGNPEGGERSYTELEYDAAVDLNKPRILFLASDDFPLPANLIESDAKRAKLRKFRERVSGLLRHIFTSPEDLAGRIPAAIFASQGPAEKKPSKLQPYFAHPYPLQENFTGRVKERKMLTEWLAGAHSILSLAAIGGMGKSSLTWVWLQEDVLPAVQLDGALWWSFYEREASFAAFGREAFQYASGARLDPATPLYDQLRELTKMLVEKRLLLILDGFERELRAYAGLNAAYQGDDVQPDGDARACIDPHASRFLEWIASLPMASRVLITTRLHPRELDGLAGCQHQDLTSLDPDDAVHFFQAQGVKGTRAEIQAACEPYGYHPLALRLLAGLIVEDSREPGDIRVAARHPVSAELKGKANHHILRVAYDAMDEPKRELLSRLAAFRNPVGYDALVAVNPSPSENELDSALKELFNRGLLFRSEAQYDLHPVIRRYAYDRLSDKAGVHTHLRDYFSKAPAPEKAKVESLDELTPVVELYHHTVRAGLYDEAWDLFYERLRFVLHFRFGAYRTCIELLRGLFPDGETLPPRLKREDAQSSAQNLLAIAYSFSGQSRQAVALFLSLIAIGKKTGDNLSVASALSNVAYVQLNLGRLREAEQSLRLSGELSGEIRDEYQQALAHQMLGLLGTYKGEFSWAASELDRSLSALGSQGHEQGEGIIWAFRALRALLMKRPKEAVGDVRQSRRLADVERVERDIIQAEWLLGWALIGESLSEAETHLSEAITRCHRINLVELEPSILLAWARWHRASKNPAQARKDAKEALAIADRCEYRLVQADVHNFLAQLNLDANDLKAARHHAEIGKERAWCDGPPHCYKPALDEAERLLRLT